MVSIKCVVSHTTTMPRIQVQLFLKSLSKALHQLIIIIISNIPQVEEERLATIERDNRILLEKMSFVMRTQGRVDNRNDYVHKSLNKTKRQRELLRVTHENQVISLVKNKNNLTDKFLLLRIKELFHHNIFSGYFKEDIIKGATL